jgi:hypothetical protein
VRPLGTGKTFLLEALGQEAVEEELKVAWFTLEDLGVLLWRQRADDTVSKAIARVLRADLVVLDDIGLLPVAADAAEGLYRLVDAAYEKRSVAISSNLHPSGFDELMSKKLATTTVDRPLHHAHFCQISASPPGSPRHSPPRGEPVELSTLVGGGHSPLGQIPWPPPVSSRGRQRAGFMSATGQFPLALDSSAEGRIGRPLGQ